jgi:hypothetical protein
MNAEIIGINLFAGVVIRASHNKPLIFTIVIYGRDYGLNRQNNFDTR